mgnify:FL=1
MDKLIKIGEFSKINHVSIPTLRLYDELGILKPIYVDKDSNYRYYSINQNARLDMIQYMRELNMNLSEIKNILNSNDLTLIESTLIKKKKQIKDQINELNLSLTAINRTIDSIERFRKSPKKGMITIEYIPHRKIYAIDTNINFYERDISAYEATLSDLKDDMLKNNLPQVYYYNAGSSIKKEDFINNRYISDKIFVFVDNEFPYSENIKTIESGMYACIYLDDFDDEVEYGKKLLDYCKSNGYVVSGDYICEVITEFNVFSEKKRSMYLRLQVLLTFR